MAPEQPMGDNTLPETPTPQPAEGQLEELRQVATDAIERGTGLDASALTPEDTVRADLNDRFRYHAPSVEQSRKYAKLRGSALMLALEIFHECPPSRERSRAWSALEDAIFNANAAIARHG